MTATLYGPRGSDTPVAMVADGQRFGAPYDPAEVPLARFESYSLAAANLHFKTIVRDGIRATLGGRHQDPRGPWRCRGGPEYLEEQAIRLEVSQRVANEVKGNKQLHQIGTLLGQLQPRYYAGARRGEDREFSPVELKAVQGTLDQCEPEIARLHVLAAAAQAITDDAYRAFGLTPPVRQFAVTADSDQSVSVIDARPDSSVEATTPEHQPLPPRNPNRIHHADTAKAK